MRFIAAPAAVVLALMSGCASTDTVPKDDARVSASASARCRTGSHICRKGESIDKVQSVSPEVFRDSIGRHRNPTGGR